MLTDRVSGGPGGLPFEPSMPGRYISPSSPWHHCPTRMTGPTHDIDEIIAAMRSLSVGSTGRMDEGFSWAVRLLSPNWQGEWGLGGYPSATGERRKIILFATDGNTVIYDHEAGAPYNGSFGFNLGARVPFENLARACANAHALGIETHMLFVRGNSNIVPYMQDCGREMGSYTEIRNANDMIDAFEAIFSSSGEVRLIE